MKNNSKKLMAASISASLLLSSFSMALPAGIPLANQAWAAELDKQLLEKAKQLRNAMTAEEEANIKAARERFRALKSDLSGNAELVAPIWNRVKAKLDAADNKDQYPDLTAENMLYLVLQAGIDYSPDGSTAVEVIQDGQTRRITDQLIKLGGLDKGLGEVDLKDVTMLARKTKINLEQRFRNMTAAELARLLNNRAEAEKIVEEEIGKMLDDPSIRFSKVLKNLGVTSADLIETAKRFIRKVDPDFKAILSTASLIIRTEGLGQGRSGGGRRGGGSAPAPSGSTFEGKLSDSALVKSGSTITVDAAALKAAIEAIDSGNATTDTITIAGSGDVVRVELPIAAFAGAGSSKAFIAIELGSAKYKLPVSLLSSLSSGSAGPIVVTVQRSEAATEKKVAEAARKLGIDLITTPYEFSIAVGDVKITGYNGIYVERELTIDKPVNPTYGTGVWYDPDSSAIYFIPTLFENGDGNSTARLKSPHDSIYGIIESHRTFQDIDGHWAQSDIETMASKLIVMGMSENEFAPDEKLTRAQFAALLVRSLGLKPDAYQSRFKDVTASDWHSSFVEAAFKAGLIEGYEDGTFRPEVTLDREQLAVLIARAIRFAEAGRLTSVQRDGAVFSDQHAISAWAADDVVQLASLGIVGTVDGKSFEPKQQASRAQAAVILKRMLTHLKFINE